MHLLTLAHGDGVALHSQLLGQSLNVVGGVGAHGEEADEGGSGSALPPHGLQVQNDPLCVALPHGVSNVLPGLGQRSVRTPAPAVRTG